MKKYENESEIKDLISGTLDKIKYITENKTIFGEIISLPNGVSIIPITKVTIAFVAGGGEYADVSTRRVANRFPMSAGTGGGTMISPVGYIVVENKTTKYIDVEDKNAYQTLLNIINKFISNFGEKNDKI